MKKKLAVILLVLLTALLLLPGCSSQNTEQPSEQPQEEKSVSLIISAAASLTDAVTEIKGNYEADNPNVTLTPNFASSGTLQQQIEGGAPADVFISAAQNKMDPLEEKDLIIKETRKDLLKNSVALITPQDNTTVTDIQSLLDDGVKQIAVGDPESVPAGKYAKEVLTYLEMWDTLEPKIILAKDVRQVLTYVETGNVDAGFVYMTDAKVSSEVKIITQAPDGSHTPVTYPAAVVKSTKELEASQAFLDYLSSPAAKEVFEKYGFAVIQ
ncbi:MAG: molybdate ABC transporter substrate-binding protein [Peptococcaceae bacterium]